MALRIDTEFLTVAEAAKALRVDRSTVRRWIANGDLPAYRVGPRRVRIKRDDLAQVVRPTTAATSPSPRLGMHYAESDDELRLPLTEEERDRALAALEAGNRIREDLLRQRGGVPFSPSWELINEARDERTEQLL
ncbi:MAG TPA: helix-turn-helix domain-containing protein [Thermomicrobiales bacterium]